MWDQTNSWGTVDDTLSVMLADEQHRTANEISSALAALHLGQRVLGDGSSFIQTAIARLEGFERSRRLLAEARFAGCDAIIDLPALFASMMRGREGVAEIDFMARPQSVPLNAPTASTLLSCAHEMVTNAWKNSDDESLVRVALRVTPVVVELGVINDVVSVCPEGRWGSGHKILEALCHRLAGHYERVLANNVHIARVRLPRSPRPDPLSALAIEN